MNDSESWSPYAAGSLAGVLAVLSIWIVGKFLGASTSFVRTAGMIENLFIPEKVATMDYFVKYAPKVDWQLMFVVGILIGSFIAAIISGSFRLQAVPDMWKTRFGSNVAIRAIVAFIGGIIAIFGARFAGGCPSGHGLSGLMQLSISGFIALISFFVGGVVVARLLYGGGQKR